VTIGLELATGRCSQTYLYIYRRGRKQPPVTFLGEVINSDQCRHVTRRTQLVYQQSNVYLGLTYFMATSHRR